MSEVNPYASPVSDPATAEEAAAGMEYAPASQGKRFLNLIIDNVVIQLLALASGMAFGWIYSSLVGPPTSEGDSTLDVLGMIVGLLTSLGYFVFMELAFQRTIAKFITGTRVVSADGSPPSTGQIIGRSFARFVPFEPFSFLGSKNPVGWHDSWSGTRVVTAR